MGSKKKKKSKDNRQSDGEDNRQVEEASAANNNDSFLIQNSTATEEFLAATSSITPIRHQNHQESPSAAGGESIEKRYRDDKNDSSTEKSVFRKPYSPKSTPFTATTPTAAASHRKKQQEPEDSDDNESVSSSNSSFAPSSTLSMASTPPLDSSLALAAMIQIDPEEHELFLVRKPRGISVDELNEVCAEADFIGSPGLVTSSKTGFGSLPEAASSSSSTTSHLLKLSTGNYTVSSVSMKNSNQSQRNGGVLPYSADFQTMAAANGLYYFDPNEDLPGGVNTVPLAGIVSFSQQDRLLCQSPLDNVSGVQQQQQQQIVQPEGLDIRRYPAIPPVGIRLKQRFCPFGLQTTIRTEGSSRKRKHRRHDEKDEMMETSGETGNCIQLHNSSSKKKKKKSKKTSSSVKDELTSD